jgi:hypothetical protein
MADGHIGERYWDAEGQEDRLIGAGSPRPPDLLSGREARTSAKGDGRNAAEKVAMNLVSV